MNMPKYQVIYDDGVTSVESLDVYDSWIEARQFIEDQIMDNEGERAEEMNYTITQIYES